MSDKYCKMVIETTCSMENNNKEKEYSIIKILQELLLYKDISIQRYIYILFYIKYLNILYYFI